MWRTHFAERRTSVLPGLDVQSNLLEIVPREQTASGTHEEGKMTEQQIEGLELPAKAYDDPHDEQDPAQPVIGDAPKNDFLEEVS